jgi:glycosyltransferase involved in cell wall biosynthesis
MRNPAGPRISVITVSLNNRAGLEKTIISVLAQRDVTIEFILIDGGSTDGSLEIIRRYEGQLTSWISEPDRGPYDAMNKGISFARGEWINFLNSGDVYSSPDSLAAIMPNLQKNDIDAVYGDSIADYGDFRVFRKAGPFKDIWKGMVFSHQALFMRKSILEKEKFDTGLKKIADYDLVLRCLKDPERVVYEPVTMVTCDAFGISNRRQAHIVRDYYRRAKKSKILGIGRKSYYLKRFLYLSAIDIIKAIMPGKAYSSLIHLIRKNELTHSKTSVK